MKWSGTITDQKTAIVTIRNSDYRIDRLRFLTALLRSSMKKRKLDNSDVKSCSNHVLQRESSPNGHEVVNRQRAKRIRSSFTKEELSAIQTQLAVLSDGDGDRPIHIAVANENVKLVHKLCVLMVKNSIPLDITNYLRQTPLHLAVILRNITIIKILLHFGASPVVCDRNGNSVLHLAVKSCSSKEVLHLLMSHKKINTILDSMDYEGYSPLHYAVFKNNTNAVRILKAFGADMNKIDGKSGRTALIHAILEQNADMVELLLNSGCCPHKVDYSGRSAQEMALQITNRQIVSLLEKYTPPSDVTAVKEQTKPISQSAKAKRTKVQN